MRSLPPLNHLRSFEASARSLSFTHAAEELNLTQAAVSGHVRVLEQFIGGPLFKRHPRSLSLTSLGKAYLPSVQQALNQVEQATVAIWKQRGGNRVVVSSPISLIGCWLSDVLGRFSEHHPEVPIAIHGSVWADEEPEIADIIISHTHKDNLQGDTISLWRENLIVVCSPDFKVMGKPLRATDMLSSARLIHTLGRSEFWSQMMSHYGLGSTATQETCQTNSFQSALELASSKIGVAIIPEFMAQPWLADGRLVAPFGPGAPCPWVTTISDSSLLNSEAATKLHQFIISEAGKRTPV